ncbi:alpha/beta fold hydrolase [Rhodoferax sp. 4810]|nr:alpha/beta fold hydrolase [Rhodoferax jenense]
MLALLLRGLYLFQLISGALLGTYLAVLAAEQNAGVMALLLVPLCALLLPLLLQFLVILTSLLISRTPGLGGAWWGLLWREFTSAVQIFMLRQPWPRQPNSVQMPPGSQAVPHRVPVVLVHGYVCNHRVWDAMTLALRQAGHPLVAVDLEPLFGSIDDYAPVLESAVTRLMAQTGAKQVALVGHSMGGLAIRAWLRSLKAGQLKRVARVLTLGSPHQGTALTHSAPTLNGKQMLFRSDWVQALARSEDAQRLGLMHIALNINDNICIPQREQVLPGVPVTEFHGIGHLEMCLNPRVISWTCQQLASLTPTGRPA